MHVLKSHIHLEKQTWEAFSHIDKLLVGFFGIKFAFLINPPRNFYFGKYGFPGIEPP